MERIYRSMQRVVDKPLSMSKKRVLGIAIPVVILLVGIGIFAGLMGTKPKLEKQVVEERAWLVRSEVVDFGAHVPVLSLYGRIESPSQVTLTAAIDADVVTVDVKAGDTVEAGQLLVELDAREAQQRLRQREAELAEMKALIDAEKARFSNDKITLEFEKEILKLTDNALDRTRSLEQRKLASKTQTDEARQTKVRQELALANRRYTIKEHPARLAQLKARFERVAAQVELARLDLERTRIIAPYTAQIIVTHVAAGQRLRVGDGLLDLYDAAALEVRAQIPSQYMAMVRSALVADDALVASGNVDGVKVHLSLDRLASQVEQGRGGVDAFFRVEQGASVLQVGRVLDLYLNLPPESPTITVPREALYGTDRIYKIIDDRLDVVVVTVVGEQRNEDESSRLILRSDALNEGDKVLVTKFANAMEGLRVTVRQEGG